MVKQYFAISKLYFDFDIFFFLILINFIDILHSMFYNMNTMKIINEIHCNNVEALKMKKNAVSKEIPVLKKEGKDVAPVFAEMKKNVLSVGNAKKFAPRT